MKRLLLAPLMRTGFRQQLVLTFTVGILLLAVISSLAISKLSSGTVRDKLIEEGRHATESLAAQSTLALLYRSADNAKDAMKVTLAFPDILGVEIYDSQHKMLVSEGEKALPDSIDVIRPQVPQLEHETDQAWYFAAPVYTGLPIGEEDESPFETGSFEPELIGYVRLVKGK